MSSPIRSGSSTPEIPSRTYENRDQVQLSLNSQYAAWLKMVEYHAQSGSAESQLSLAELAGNIPVSVGMTDEEQALIDKVKRAAQTRTYDPRLSPDSKSLLNQISKMDIDYSISPKPSCAKRLDFDNLDEIDW